MFSVVGMLETDAVMISFQPPKKVAYRPTLKIKGIGVPVTLECFVMNHYDQRVSCGGGGRHRGYGNRSMACSMSSSKKHAYGAPQRTST
jgi:hypothetical protein